MHTWVMLNLIHCPPDDGRPVICWMWERGKNVMTVCNRIRTKEGQETNRWETLSDPCHLEVVQLEADWAPVTQFPLTRDVIKRSSSHTVDWIKIKLKSNNSHDEHFLFNSSADPASKSLQPTSQEIAWSWPTKKKRQEEVFSCRVSIQ